MKIGLYLAYPPHSRKFSLKQEGLGRYVSSLLEAFIKKGHDVTIACPPWSIGTIQELLESVNIDKDSVEFLYPKAANIWLDWYYKKSKKKKKEKKFRFKTAVLNFSDSLVISVVLLKNYFILFVLAIIGAVLFLSVLPFALLFILIWKIYSIFCRIMKRFVKKEYLKEEMRKVSVLSEIYRHFRSVLSSERIKELLRYDNAQQIIRAIDGMKEPADVWYCPMAFWPEFNNITGTKVTCAPDLVTTEFATNFSVDKLSENTENVRKTIKGGTYFITYSEYLKNSLLVHTFGKQIDNIGVIPHSVNDTKRYIDVTKCFNKKGFDYDVNIKYAKGILRSLADINTTSYMRGTDIESGFDFTDIQYIFYASQLRGNKNILTLVKAYEYMLREKNVKVKLFLTCNLHDNKVVQKYIFDHRLQYDILTFHGCTNPQLSALYKCAALSVNPTLYEGGFPFTFGEGMSVGTPSVMGRIPQVLEGIGDYDFDCCLFDPYSYKDMAEKIIYGLEHREELYKLQKPLFDKMKERTWEDVGEEYIKVFQRFVEMDRERDVAL